MRFIRTFSSGLTAFLLVTQAQGQADPPPPDTEEPSAGTDGAPAAETAGEAVVGTELPPSQEPVPDSPSTQEVELQKRVDELEHRFDAMSAQQEEESLERLIQDAQNEARAAEEEQRPEQREFLEGGLALQKLNPELTVCGDVLLAMVIDGDRFYAGETDRSGLLLRGLGVHLQHVLDPYSMFKSALHFSPAHGVALEELYVSWFGLVPTTSLAVGRFRQNFGVLNRWHEHDLDQSSYPLALRLVLGEEGLTGDGLMFKWLMPSLWAHANELTLEVVDGNNETLFSGEHFSIPSTLLHLKNYYDLSDSTYLELGLTGMFGYNNKRGVLTDQNVLADEPWRATLAGGADLTVYWSPPSRAKYESFTWRSELYHASRELPADRPRRWSRATGLYSYLQYQLSERWFSGVRGDVVLSTVRDDDEPTWDVVPYVTFWQSEFVYLRLEYQHGERIPYATPEGTFSHRTDDRALLQIDFAAGPHKHEKY